MKHDYIDRQPPSLAPLGGVKHYEQSLTMLRSTYLKAKSPEDRMRHKQTILTMMHYLHLAWEVEWRRDLEGVALDKQRNAADR